MKNMIFPLFIILFGCGQSQIEEKSGIQEQNKKHFAEDSVIISAVSSNDKTADTSFKYFEDRILNEDDVPYNLVNKFVNVTDTLISSNVKYIGKGVSYNKAYKFFYLKGGNKDSGQAVLITYDTSNRQIDSKVLLLYCKNCLNDVQSSDITFKTGETNDSFIIKYFNALSTGVMPLDQEMKGKREEYWHINKKGYFEKNK
jgi:hypothetical protein